MKGKERLKQNIIDNAEHFKSVDDIGNYRYASVKSGKDRKGNMQDCKRVVKEIIQSLKLGTDETKL